MTENKQFQHPEGDLGATVAALLKKGVWQRAGLYVVLGMQVPGYLCWYGDLMDQRGLWPLLDAIQSSLHRPGEEREALTTTLEMYAKEWDCPAAEVRSATDETARRAVELHPAFASQVLGGLSAPWDLLSFLKASVRWLDIHYLVLSKDASEVFWQFKCERKLEEKIHYISEEDRWIVQKHGEGLTFGEIGRTLSYSIDEVKHIYEQTMERVKLLLQDSRRGPDRTLGDYLASVGFLPWMDGVKELEATLQMVMDDPSLLDSMGKKLYPTMAEKFGVSPRQAYKRIHDLMERALWNNEKEAHGEYDEFFRKAKLTGYNDKIQNLLTALMWYVETEQKRSAPL